MLPWEVTHANKEGPPLGIWGDLNESHMGSCLAIMLQLGPGAQRLGKLQEQARTDVAVAYMSEHDACSSALAN